MRKIFLILTSSGLTDIRFKTDLKNKILLGIIVINVNGIIKKIIFITIT